MNAILDKAVEQADLIDTWTTAKYRFYSIDMDDAGPVPGSRKLIQPSFYIYQASATGEWFMGAFTNQPHGFVVGERVALFGITGKPPNFAPSQALPLGAYRKPTTSNGKKYRVVKAGTTGDSEPSSWTTTDGTLVGSGTAIFACDGPVDHHVLNGNRLLTFVSDTQLETKLDLVPYLEVVSGGYVASLSKTFLPEFAPPVARTAMSNPLTGKTVLPGPVLDCDDSALNLTGQDASEVVLLVKAAALDADPDLLDTGQRIIGYYDTMPSLPFVANAGIVALAIPNTVDRLMRF